MAWNLTFITKEDFKKHVQANFKIRRKIGIF